jgi:diguanylate cyclase (GGDEF)-like protein/PAS domain S-box-containing protein
LNIVKSLKATRSELNFEFKLGQFGDVAMHAADWFWALDKDLKFTYLSESFEELMGLKISDILGKTRNEAFTSFIHDVHKWKFDDVNLQQHQHQHYSMVWTLNKPDSTTRILRTHGKPQFDADGLFNGYRGFGSDITESIEVLEDLASSESRFKDFADVAADWFCELDEHLRITYMSGDIHPPSGRKSSDMIGMSAEDSYEGRLDKENKWGKYLSKLELHQPFKLEYEWIRDDGAVVYVKSQGKPFFGEDNQFKGYRCCGTNITETRLVELALQQSEQRLRDFADTAADWFWEQDRELKFTYLSDSAPEFKGGSVHHVIGKTRQEVLTGQDFDVPKWKDLMDKLTDQLPFDDFEFRSVNPDNTEIWIRISGKPFFDLNNNFSGYRGCGNDITQSYRMSKQLAYQATHDALTDLTSRAEFEARLDRVIKHSKSQQSNHALCYIDLDQFKVVNDTCGHAAGDELLRQVSTILVAKVSQRDTVARLGGDEFGLLLEHRSLEQGIQVAESARKAIDSYRFSWGGNSFKLGASMGLIPIDQLSGSVDSVMREADATCYEAKDTGRNRIHIYKVDSPKLAQRHEEMQQIVEINRAFDDQRFVLYHQKIYNLQKSNDDQPMFSEVLVRMLDQNNNLVPPGVFLPTAERYNLITRLDIWVVTAVLEWLQKEVSAGFDIYCTVNLSGSSIADKDFLRLVLEKFDSSDVEPWRICFEITETAAIANLTRATQFIDQLKERGCSFALDDFGTGFSSFAYLKTLPVDYLKIDGFFVRDMLKDRVDLEMVKSINDIGHVMGKKTIAEFVEDLDTMELLQKMGVDYAQGYAISKPIPVDKTE